jgi:hypothetical protein
MASRSLSRKNTADCQVLSREILRQVLADSHILPERLALHGRTGGAGALYDEETRELFREDLQKKYPKALDCFDDFVRRNQRRAVLEKIYGDISDIGLKPEPRLEELRRIGRQTWWVEFHKRFPNVVGTLSVSAVGFSSTYCYAMISVTSGVGPLHSSGNTYLYRRENEAWRRIDTIAHWMS